MDTPWELRVTTSTPPHWVRFSSTSARLFILTRVVVALYPWTQQLKPPCWKVKQRIKQRQQTCQRQTPLPTLCFDYYPKLLLALASTRADFSNDVANLSAADLEDVCEVIENMSNLAFTSSIVGDLMSPNPNICNHSRGLGVSEDLRGPGVFPCQ